ADFGDDLDGARAGADDADDLVLEFGEVRARVFVVPSRGVERMAPERLHPLYLRELGLGEGAVGADYEAGAHMVAAVGFEMPHPLGFVPYGGSDGGLEDGEFVEVVAAGDRLAVGENFGAAGIVMPGHIGHLIQKRQVVVRDHIASDPGVAVPVPRAAHIAAPLYEPDAFDAAFAQAGGGQKRGKAAPDEEAFDGIVDRRAGFDLGGEGVDFISGKRTGEVGGVLSGAFGAIAEAEVAFLGEFPLDRVVVFLGMTRPGE